MPTVTEEEARAFGQEQLATETPQNGIVVIYMSNCHECQNSLRNTNMATETRNGTHVKWIDIATREGQLALLALPGVTAAADNRFLLAGKPLTGVPTTVAMQDGRVTEVLKVGVLARGNLDTLAENLSPEARLGSAMNKAIAEAALALSDGKSTGSTIPRNYNEGPQTVQRG